MTLEDRNLVMRAIAIIASAPELVKIEILREVELGGLDPSEIDEAGDMFATIPPFTA